MCRFVKLQTAYLHFSSFSLTISFLNLTQQLSLLASMLDLSTAVTIESPFVPYSPDSCCIILYLEMLVMSSYSRITRTRVVGLICKFPNSTKKYGKHEHRGQKPAGVVIRYVKNIQQSISKNRVPQWDLVAIRSDDASNWASVDFSHLS